MASSVPGSVSMITRFGEPCVARRSDREEVERRGKGQESTKLFHEGSPLSNVMWAYSSMPAMEADIRFAMVPASMARIPSRASSPFLFGASAPMPPI